MRTAVTLVVALILAVVWVALTAGLTGAQVTEAIGAVARVLLPTAIAGVLLVRYFAWRRRLIRRVPADDDLHDVLDEAATLTP